MNRRKADWPSGTEFAAWAQPGDRVDFRLLAWFADLGKPHSVSSHHLQCGEAVGDDDKRYYTFCRLGEPAGSAWAWVYVGLLPSLNY